MQRNDKFLNSILNSITDHIVVIDKNGYIQFVNESWAEFGDNNACLVKNNWDGINYLEQCDKAAASGDNYGIVASIGIRNVIAQKDPVFYFEYPCHSPAEKRWFMMRVTPFEVDNEHFFVISHQNITERKLAEEKIKQLAQLDGLTNIANRRTFDKYLLEEWRRCCRLHKPISLALIDLDYFKLLNDTYGHQTGDECLRNIALLLKDFAKRPNDICARYGGEEFVLVWGDTNSQAAKSLSERLLHAVSELKIPNEESPISKFLTISIGLATLTPEKNSEEGELISCADKRLYKAKDKGRNRIEF